MTNIMAELNRRVELIASDHQSGASEILDEVLAVLTDALAAAVPLKPIGRAICQAQPSMAPVWNAVLAALASEHVPERFERFAQRVRRAPAALRRFAAEVL